MTYCFPFVAEGVEADRSRDMSKDTQLTVIIGESQFAYLQNRVLNEEARRLGQRQ